jgi:hypothetical protein
VAIASFAWWVCLQQQLQPVLLPTLLLLLLLQVLRLKS